MEFYLIFSSVLRQFPPGKWVPHIWMVEGGSKQSDFFTGVRQNLIRVLRIKYAILESKTRYSKTCCSVEKGGIHSPAPTLLYNYSTLNLKSTLTRLVHH